MNEDLMRKYEKMTGALIDVVTGTAEKNDYPPSAIINAATECMAFLLRTEESPVLRQQDRR